MTRHDLPSRRPPRRMIRGHHHHYRGGEIVGRVRLSRTCLRCGRYQDTGPLHAGTVPAPASMPDTCPTCGSPVTIVSTDEGTSHYRPADARRALRCTYSERWGGTTDLRCTLDADHVEHELGRADGGDVLTLREAREDERWQAFQLGAQDPTPPVLTLDTDLVAALRELAGTGPLHEGVVSVPVVPLGAPRAGERVR